MPAAPVGPAIQDCAKLASAMLISALLCGVLAAIVFLTFPQLDLVVARYFYRGGGDFIGQSLGAFRLARVAFAIFFYASAAAALAGMFLTWRRPRTWLRLAFSQWLFLAICLGVGPGLVANVILKDHLGRARPKHVVEFGGTKAFSPPLIPSQECPTNCSFIGGEAAATFTPFFAASLVMPQSAPWLLAVGTICGLACGLVRIAQGAHFLSDIIFAGVFMAVAVACVHAAMQSRGNAPDV
jgi:lipid A 4'-phosphatase